LFSIVKRFFGLIRAADGRCEKPRSSSFLHLYRLLSCYLMTKIALQGNVDCAEDIKLLSSFKKMYKNKTRKLTRRKRSTCGISCWTEFL
jgi:hypothetical protein